MPPPFQSSQAAVASGQSNAAPNYSPAPSSIPQYSPTAPPHAPAAVFPGSAQPFTSPYTPPAGPVATPPIINPSSANASNPAFPQIHAGTSSGRRLTRIAPQSAFKMVTVIYGLIYGLLGLLGLLVSVLMIVLGADTGFLFEGGGLTSFVILLLSYIVSVFVVALFAGISAAISAWIYNLVARRIGGIEVEVA